MEKALLADDPRLVSALTGAPTKASRRNLGLAVVLFLQVLVQFSVVYLARSTQLVGLDF
jgi:hypothetical protein